MVVGIGMSRMNNIPYNAVMVDLETMSTDSNASIISIGAVKFWLNVRQTEFTDDQLFYTAVSLKSSQEAGLHIKADAEQAMASEGENGPDIYTVCQAIAATIRALQSQKGAEK